jgi:ATP-dependent protease HslVU (ClpYQ) peptidase subunit
MSIAVAVKSAGRIVIASDTKRTFGSGEVPDANLTDFKIRKVGDAYLATTGWGLYSNILDDYLQGKRRARLTDQASIFAFFRTFWKDLHERYSFVSDQRPDDESPFGDLDASFLVASNKGIYSVACDMSVTEFQQYYAIGSGAPYALGALHALYDESQDPIALADKACRAAMALDIYCGGSVTPFVLGGRGVAKRSGRARKGSAKAKR